ncbi:hypothetical protein [Methylosinus sporium]|uniref:hypothetical protein n=1 Tax=Methylosinus sporium TaxID=428 RepID=UPI00383B6523
MSGAKIFADRAWLVAESDGRSSAYLSKDAASDFVGGANAAALDFTEATSKVVGVQNAR